MLLPQKKNCTLVFVQLIVNNKKKAFFKWQRKSRPVPFWEELSIDNMWDHARTIKDFLDYMPDEWNCPKKVERAYFWDVLTTLAYDWVDAVIKECEDLRAAAAARKKVVVKKTVAITHEWGKLFLQGSFESSKYSWYTSPPNILTHHLIQSPRASGAF